MTNALDLLRRAGETLYGRQWQRPLARMLDVDDRFVRRVVAGERSVPERWWLPIQGALAERRVALRGELDRVAPLMREIAAAAKEREAR
jgi:hypothetical protein